MDSHLHPTWLCPLVYAQGEQITPVKGYRFQRDSECKSRAQYHTTGAFRRAPRVHSKRRCAFSPYKRILAAGLVLCTSKGRMGWYGARVLRWRRMKESPVSRPFASAAAVGSSTGAADAMVRRNTLSAWLRLWPAKWNAAGDGFLMRNRVDQSINEAAPPSRELLAGWRRRGSVKWAWGCGCHSSLVLQSPKPATV